MPAALSAQARITRGTTVSGVLDASDSRIDNKYHEDWVFAGRSGESVTIALDGSFDTFVKLFRDDGDEEPEWYEIATDDDSGEGLNSLLVFTLPADGDYMVCATSAFADRTGTYTLRVSGGSSSASSSASPRRITRGTAVSDALGASDNRETDGKYYDDWQFTGRSGESVTITLDGSFDPFIKLWHQSSSGWSMIASDDDGGDGLNSLLVFTLPADGEYVARATSASADRTGSYTLRVSGGSSSASSARSPRRITRGTPASDALDASDNRETDGKYYDDWAFTGRQGESVTITLDGSFDTFVKLWQQSSAGWSMIASDDDGGDGLNSLLVFTLPADGEYVVRATSAAADRTGSYTLRVSGGGAPASSLAERARAVGDVLRGLGSAPLARGSTVSGALTTSDYRDSSKYEDAYTFTGRRGETVTISMTSAFDNFIELYGPNTTYTRVASDDDSGDGLNALLTTTLSADGAYYIRATSRYADQTGSYTIGLTSNMSAPPPRTPAAGPAPAPAATANRPGGQPSATQRTTARPTPATPAPTPAPAPTASGGRRFVRSGSSVSGQLDASDPANTDGTRYESWTYLGLRGENIRIIMRSTAVDANLRIGTMRGATFSQLGAARDGAGGTDALLEITLPADGEYVIRAGATSRARNAGAYTLLVQAYR